MHALDFDVVLHGWYINKVTRDLDEENNICNQAQILLQVGTTYEVDEQLTAEEMDILSGVYKVYTGM